MTSTDPSCPVPATSAVNPRWRQTAAWFAAVTGEVRKGLLHPSPVRPPGWIRLSVGAGTALVGSVLLIGWITGLAAAVEAGLYTVGSHPLGRIPVTGMRSYLDAHADGVGLAPALLWQVWVLLLITVFTIAALTRNPGARIAWTVLGATAVAMVYAATPGSSAAAAAGITAAWWLLTAPITFRASTKTE